MEQTAVEWLINKVIEYQQKGLKISKNLDKLVINQAKEMEKQQADYFAIEFAKWCAELKVWDNETYVNNTFEMLLQQFKNK